ncbi:hypothetical protein CsatB_006942 [Cannabis sativa]
MLTICQLCGDKGYSAALIYCEKCEEYARHGYCMDVLPEVNDENVTWFCEDCKPDLAKQPILDKLRCPPSPSSVLKESDTVRTNRPCGPIKKNQKVPSNLVSKNKAQKPSYNELQCRKNNNEVSSDLVSKNKLQKPSYNELQCKENDNEDQKFRKRQKLVREDDTTKHLNTSKVAVSVLKPLKIVEGSVNSGHAEKSQVHMNDSLPINNVLQSRKKQCRDPKLKNQQESKRLKFSANHKSSDFLKDTVTSVSLAKAGLQKNPDKDPRLRKKGRLVIKKKVKPSEFSDSLLKSSNVLQEKPVGGSVARTEVLIRDSTISPSSNEPENSETCDPKFKTKQELVIEKKVKPAEISDAGLKSSTVLQEKVVGGSVATKEVVIHDNTISPSSNEPGNNETCDTKVKTQQELVIEKVGSVEISNAGLMSSIVLQEKVVGGSVATTEVPIRDVTISPSGDEPKNKEKCNPKFETKQRSLVESVEAAEPLKTIEVTPTDPNPSNMLEYNCYVEPQPLLEPMWRGSFVIHNIESKCIGRVLVAAHWSNLASSKACEMRNLLPELVSVELSTRSHCWPIKFQHWGPSIHSVGLFCLPQDRDDKTYDILVNDMINGDFAMRALLENVELLVFTSYVLPFHYKMFHSRYYLWGIFRDRQASGVRTGATRGMKGYPEFSTSPVMSFSHSDTLIMNPSIPRDEINLFHDDDDGTKTIDTPSQLTQKKFNDFIKERRDSLGMKIEYNHYGRQEIEKGAGTEIESFIDVSTRRHVPLNYNKWKDVPYKHKYIVWKEIQSLLDVNLTTKKKVLKEAGEQWRNWKTNLTRDLIDKYKDVASELLTYPPESYAKWINLEDWQGFVAKRLTAAWETTTMRKQQQERQAMNMVKGELLDDHQERIPKISTFTKSASIQELKERLQQQEQKLNDLAKLLK